MTTRCLNLRHYHLHPRRPRSASRLFSILVLLLVAFVGFAPLTSRAAQSLPAQDQPTHRLSTPTNGTQLPPGLAEVLSQKGLLAAAQNHQQFSQQQELHAADGAPGDDFGYSVAVSANGHVALVGADVKDGYKGAAYVFQEQHGSWTQQQELSASDGVPGDQFGWSVALSAGGNVALVGAPFGDGAKGVAYVFQERHGSWTQQQELRASDGNFGDIFGWSVALNSSGNIALVGAIYGGGVSGAAYVFQERHGSWTQQQKMQASDAIGGDNFGNSVALNPSGNTALVGAPYGGDNFTGTGTAYVFQQQHGSWTQQQELQASDGNFGDSFGYSVALNASGNTALVGATGNGYKGAAYVFQQQHGSWTQQQELQASDGNFGDSFGYSVALSDDGHVALMGAPSHRNGAAYVFQQHGSWTQQQELQASDGPDLLRYAGARGDFHPASRETKQERRST